MSNAITNARGKLLERRLDALLVSSAYNIGYLTGFFGFSKIEREGYLLLTQNALYFFASGLNSEAVSEHIDTHPWGGLRRLAHPRGVKLIEISPRSHLTKNVLAKIIKKEKIKRLGFEKHSLSFAEYEQLTKDLAVTLVPTEHLIEELRMIKTTDEIESIEKACKLGDKAFNYILKKIKPGITEKELAFEIEIFIRKHGGEISFPPIVAFGPNSSIPHHMTSDKGLMMNDKFVLLDFGVKIDNYCSDMTRTIFFGKATRDQKRMHQTVLEAQKKSIEHLGWWQADPERSRGRSHGSCEVNSKGIKAKDVDKVARSYIIKQGYPTIPHGLGHGIGLEVHELPSLSPKSKVTLKPGMVFSIEPGIYLPASSRRSQGEGGAVGGIRLEDLVVLEPLYAGRQASGPRLLTKAKRELIEV